jgi:cation diffusion facilitator family transporter
MLDQIRDWLGFGGFDRPAHAGHRYDHSKDGHNKGGHGHTHGVIDATISSSKRGIWAIKWSFVILAITAALQFTVVVWSGSVALLADTIHNIGDATTAIPLWIAFTLARRKPSKTFTYGLGRAEDLAGILIVLIILFSAILAGYEAISRLLHPQPVAQLGWLVGAGIIGFLGNEIVAVFRIRVGREMNSAALIADGYHARTDGLTSLAVVVGAIGVWLGFSLADPIIGLLITITIFGIVWQSARAVITRMLDGVEPSVVDEIHHAAEHVPGIEKVVDAKARWLGHDLHVDVTIAVNDTITVAQANAVAAALQGELRDHIPGLAAANIRFGTNGSAALATPSDDGLAQSGSGHHHAPDPVAIHGRFVDGFVDIFDTPDGERMRLTATRMQDKAEITVVIDRPLGDDEKLPLLARRGRNGVFISDRAPAEPHQFNARMIVRVSDQEEALPFRITEPEGHHH